mgnify:CR=1 FL=1
MLEPRGLRRPDEVVREQQIGVLEISLHEAAGWGHGMDEIDPEIAARQCLGELGQGIQITLLPIHILVRGVLRNYAAATSEGAQLKLRLQRFP